MLLPFGYAVSGPELVYAATLRLRSVRPTASPLSLSSSSPRSRALSPYAPALSPYAPALSPYAPPYRPTPCPIALRARYAMRGTEIAGRPYLPSNVQY
eukprot:3306886-Rhodomonas_salina.1